MKKYFLIALSALLLPLTSCEEFLEEEMVTTLTQDYYNTPEGLESLTKGCYKILRYKTDYNQGEYLFGANNDIEVFSWSAADRIVNGNYSSDAWGAGVTTGQRITPFINNLIGSVTNTSSVKYTEGCYPSIGACNVFLDHYAALPMSSISDADKASLVIRKGEILFLRAYSYYLITNMVGAAPLILKSYTTMPENFYFPKAPLDTIYAQLISDVTSAIAVLPTTVAAADKGRITKQAAAHFLSKLYLNRAQASEWKNSSEEHLKMLYKGGEGSTTADLDSCVKYSTMVIDLMKSNNASYGGLATDFGALWLNDGTLSRDNVTEIILAAQYEPTQQYNGRYGDASAVSLTHVYNSNHTTANAGILRDINYGRPYATLMPSDWAYDQFSDKANDSRYYKSFLTNYKVTATDGSGKPWDIYTAYTYNNVLKPSADPNVTVTTKGRMSYGNVGLVYVENSKSEPYDSMWVMSHPYVMNVRWMVGSPSNAGYQNILKTTDGKKDSLVLGFKAGYDPNQAIVTDYVAQGRKIYYRLGGTKGSAFGIDRGTDPAQWYMGTNKWLDKTRGQSTNANGSQSFDTPIFRLAEAYLIRSEAYGRKSMFTEAIADLNVIRKRAAYHAGEKRDQILVTAEASVLNGSNVIPTAEKVTPYSVVTDSYNSIKIDGTEWDGTSAKSTRENYPPTATTTLDRFIHFIYNERGREFIFELTTTEDLHNAGILYDRVYYRDMLGAPSTSTGTTAYPFPTDDLGGTGTTGAKGVGKGSFAKNHTFKAWPTAFLQLLTDPNGNALDLDGQAEYQNPGY
jgi:starch-binding outer membrane protein, SusD/RagB family